MRLSRRVLEWLALVSAAALAGCGAGGGAGLGALNLGTDLVVADLDGDGRADVLALTHEFGEQPVIGRLHVRRQNAEGSFRAAETHRVGCYPWSMTLADIDGDGRLDLVVTDVGAFNCSDPAAGNALYLLRQDPALPGRFLAPERLAAGTYAYRVAVADFDGDGIPDLAYGDARRGARVLAVLRQDGRQRGRFLPPIELPMPGPVGEVVAGDLDDDGRSDLFLVFADEPTGYTPNTWLAVMRQAAGGGFGAPQRLSAQTGLNVQRLAMLDIDGDGRRDLIVHFRPFSTDYAARLRVLRQTADGAGWWPAVDTLLDGVRGTDGTAFGDLDANGLVDVVLAGSFPVSGTPFEGSTIESRVNLRIGSSAGSFRDGGSVTVEPLPDAVAVADLDGDGRQDIVLHDGDTQWWMRQSSAQPGRFAAPQPLP